MWQGIGRVATRRRRLTLLVTLALLPSCSTTPETTVRLYGSRGEFYIGTLRYDEPARGAVEMPKGPSGEAYDGAFALVERGAAGSDRAPAAETVQGTWLAAGSGGSSMSCELDVDPLGQGEGACTHSDGRTFRITLKPPPPAADPLEPGSGP